MSRWTQGEAAIEQLIHDQELERVPADTEIVALLVSAARRHIESASLLAPVDVDGAYSLAYDAARKAATALLAHQGLRPTSRGGHLVVVRSMREQFPNVPGLSDLDMLRRRRNQTEYPDPRRLDLISVNEAEEAIEVASATVQSAERLLQLTEIGVF